VASNKLTVVKSNSLIEASYKLNTTQQKIILILVSTIQRGDEDFKEYTFAIKDLMQLLGVNNPNMYGEQGEIIKITEDLTKENFKFKIGKTSTTVSWLAGVRYTEGDGLITLQFSPWLTPFLLQLKGRFTEYRLENVTQLKSNYSIRVYELLKQYEDFKKERFFSVDELRELFQVEEGTYSLYTDFRRNVILVAQKELKDKTDICFEFTEVKTGRKVSGIVFTIKKNNKSFEAGEIDMFAEHYQEIVAPLVNPQDKINSDIQKRLLEEFKFLPRTVRSIIKKHDMEYINTNLDIAVAAFKAGKVDDLKAYARSALKDDYRKQLTEHDLQRLKERKEASKRIIEAQAQAVAAIEMCGNEELTPLSPEWAEKLEKITALRKNKIN
jgi:plasmid replication initiation protein